MFREMDWSFSSMLVCPRSFSDTICQSLFLYSGQHLSTSPGETALLHAAEFNSPHFLSSIFVQEACFLGSITFLTLLTELFDVRFYTLCKQVRKRAGRGREGKFQREEKGRTLMRKLLMMLTYSSIKSFRFTLF